jgi:lysophospholipase L1-like esterase
VKSLRFLLPLCGLLLVLPADAAESFALRDGDRVVFVGSTLIEREQRYGYWETALTRRYPNKSIIFRNLGWSGDTVFGEARAGFDTPVEGFRRLKDHVLALKPTVLFIGYGTNESFEGKKGLPRFVKGLEKLLDAFAPAKARIVLLSPLKQENLGPPLPDPTENNKNLRMYADAIRDVAKKRGHRFVDLYELLGKEKHPLTDNGIHLTAYGYWRSAIVLERALGLPETQWDVEMSAKGEVKKAKGARVTKSASDPLRFQLTADLLPLAPAPSDGAPSSFRTEGPRLEVKGQYVLHIDPDRDQAEKLRQAIIAKNRLYFYRWRPENETYLFGFRKHEQGQNAREIPQFDPLIAEKEKDIAKLRVPVAHTYELKAEKKP